jgi:hypothetical protein
MLATGQLGFAERIRRREANGAGDRRHKWSLAKTHEHEQSNRQTISQTHGRRRRVIDGGRAREEGREGRTRIDLRRRASWDDQGSWAGKREEEEVEREETTREESAEEEDRKGKTESQRERGMTLRAKGH